MKQKIAYDKRKGFHTTYKVGDQVLLWKPLSPQIKTFGKFRNCFSGPWVIVKIYSLWTYLIKNVSTVKCEVAHFDKLRFVPPNLSGPTIEVKRAPDRPVKNNREKRDQVVQEDYQYEFLQSMFDTTTSGGDNLGPNEENIRRENRQEMDGEEHLRRSARDRRPPAHLQVTHGGRQQSYDNI
jgi:hypothetical protein